VAQGLDLERDCRPMVALDHYDTRSAGAEVYCSSHHLEHVEAGEDDDLENCPVEGVDLSRKMLAVVQSLD